MLSDGAARLANVLRDVAERSGWGAELPEGEGMGVAVAHGQERTMPTWTACVVHVAVDTESNAVTVKKIWQTIDCGTVVHPDGAMAQAEGATLWGVSLALHEGTTFVDGEVADQNLNGYTPLRMADVPPLDIQFVDSDEFPTGLGEPPLIAVAARDRERRVCGDRSASARPADSAVAQAGCPDDSAAVAKRATAIDGLRYRPGPPVPRSMRRFDAAAQTASPYVRRSEAARSRVRARPGRRCA